MVTLKIRSRSPKSNNTFWLSSRNISANVVKSSQQCISKSIDKRVALNVTQTLAQTLTPMGSLPKNNLFRPLLLRREIIIVELVMFCGAYILFTNAWNQLIDY